MKLGFKVGLFEKLIEREKVKYCDVMIFSSIRTTTLQTKARELKGEKCLISTPVNVYLFHNKIFESRWTKY